MTNTIAGPAAERRAVEYYSPPDPLLHVGEQLRARSSRPM